ncbi:hypothetical protein GCM10009736_63310 [Actinomadura bangladeshensis]
MPPQSRVQTQGRRLSRYRRWQARKRADIQAKRTRSAAKLLKKRARREALHATHVNHKISKQVVAVAARTGRGIALEDLSGIRGRVTVPRDQRARLSSWPFRQLGEFIADKARRHGVPFIEVNRPIPRSAARAADTPRGTTVLPGIISAVVGVVSLDPPTSSPGSTCATAHARRGYSSTCPNRSRHGRGWWMRPVTVRP